MANDTLKLESGYSIHLRLTHNTITCNYIIKNKDDLAISDITTGLPATIGLKTQIASEIKNAIDPNDSMKRKSLNKEFHRVKAELHSMYNVMMGEEELKIINQQQESALKERKLLKQAEKKLKKLSHPLVYIGSISDWLSAGERINIMLCFVAYCSQVILYNPISVIGLGEASSGKTYIETIAMSFIPEDYIVNEKKITESALFNRAKEDPFFYDGKIVNYGDMGGQNDRENQFDTMALMKELQTEGYLCKPLSVKDDDGNWTTHELELKGHSSLTYTTVPTDIDPQELSRSIVFTPRMDNREIFNKRSKLLSLGRGKLYEKYEEMEEEAGTIPYMVEHLKQKMSEYTILNPYIDVVLMFLQQSKYYKRDKDKYFGLLNTITAINFYQNQTYEFEDGTKVVITSKNDVKLFVTLLSPYLASITINISPKAAEIYNTLLDKIDDWKWDNAEDVWKIGITARFYFEQQKDEVISHASIKNYFGELYKAGLLTIVGKEGNANLYDVNRYEYSDLIDEIIDEDYDFDWIEMELGKEIADIMRKDTMTYELDITNQHYKVERPPWNPKST